MKTRRPDRGVQCDGKVSYATFHAAVRAMKSLIRHTGTEGSPIKPYACRFCGGFHIGHTRLKLADTKRGPSRRDVDDARWAAGADASEGVEGSP